MTNSKTADKTEPAIEPASQQPPTKTKIDKARPMHILCMDFGNGSIVAHSTQPDGIEKTISVASLLLETSHPMAATVNGKGFVYGANAARIDLDKAFNPGQTGQAKAKFEKLDLVLATCLIELGLIDGGDQLDLEVRVATPINCQVEQHQDLVSSHLIQAPKNIGGESRLVKVKRVRSYQECRPLFNKYDGVVDLGNGTTFYGYIGSSGTPTIQAINSGVGQVLIDTLAHEQIAKGSLDSDINTGKGVLNPLGLATSLASGRAIKKDGSIVYKGIEVGGVLKPILSEYWSKVVKPAIERVAGNIVKLDDKVSTIAIVGGGAALLKSVLDSEELDNVDLPEGFAIKFLKEPTKQLVKAMAQDE